ncbi:MAG: histidine--tRNA ligase [Candidatus Aenigmarchaeota archaeon]|nr:histidine--tRNA ligase [Candidatus Aenigmarchaeota archaeon]
MNWQTPRGTRDLLPEEMALRNELYEKFRRVFEMYGYGMVETPAFEDFELLAKKSGEEIKNEIYYFEDKSKRKLGLRFDPTVPICRIVATNRALTKPIKFSYITRMWRYDRPGEGRYREFWQAGCELIGPKGASADMEVLLVASALLKAAGVKNFIFRVNSRELLERMLKEIDVPKDEIGAVLRLIDKFDKIGEATFRQELKKLKIKNDSIEFLCDSIKRGGATVKFKDAESNVTAWREFKQITDLVARAKEAGIENIEWNSSIVRGIDYYTGFVFETFIKGKESIGSVCSGGRYDTLVKVYGGEDLPAVGFGLGIDRLLDATEAKPKQTSVKVFIASVNESLLNEAQSIASVLRSGGISCETDLMDRDFSKQMKYANAKSIPYVIIVGPEELKSGTVKLKEMKSGKETVIKIAEMLRRLQ